MEWEISQLLAVDRFVVIYASGCMGNPGIGAVDLF